MQDNWHNGYVTRIVQETYNTRRFWIQIRELERFDFKPGQFVTLDLPIHEEKKKRWRSYSIASAPDGTNMFELVIVLLEGGAGTTYLFNEVNVGTEIPVKGPLGVFTLPQELDRHLFLICTGTGVAPFRAMAHHIHTHGIPHRDIHLIYGCRKECDLLYAKELWQLEKELEGFSYSPTLSRCEDGWTGKRGYVHLIYEELLAVHKEPAYFFLCGWKNMIDEAKGKILGMGYDRHDIHQELYG
ncbi:ferredoxin--NADP reductase [Chitinophaga sancti]|uniref:CDP-4-dehydro-6-deoxyglucose reductase n=1 Tax=Chitinophaga sancti TaxID=1004 RepID=A0A1K1NT10_9BACT|nr:FAD-binding oxidoreductase [Chitinophaga sancti]WQD60156.1 FAD-binding oxidoreductase [Chitinophaga sancti]WQG87716.1 FAD-binding oxidoreductase [Chitinophaga sancti]SFW38373.1 CDP-4-dehydro-6-deoxyglucose reductase [Chitinophaga sancti]